LKNTVCLKMARSKRTTRGSKKEEEKIEETPDEETPQEDPEEEPEAAPEEKAEDPKDKEESEMDTSESAVVEEEEPKKRVKDDKDEDTEEQPAVKRVKKSSEAGESSSSEPKKQDDEAKTDDGREGESSKTADDLPKPVEKKKRSPDLAKFWKAVEDDPTDFTGWTYLLQFVDTTGDIDDGREAYDAFLFRYPYCYGYWKKFADLEKRKGSADKCMAVFERGIKAIALSADLWIHYLNHVKSEFGSKPDFVRSQYERAIEACGKEWRSDKLWDHFVKWETQIEKDKEVGTKNYFRVIALYDRILCNPTQGLSHQFDMFKDFVKEQLPKDVLEINDFLALRKDVLASMKKPSEDDTESKDAPGEAEDETLVTSSEEENIAMKEKIISARKKLYKATEEKVQLRWKYEDAIKRPYFHMKPLERGQLKNWADYLEFEEAQISKKEAAADGLKDYKNLTILYERCMIACALYEEFWMRYVAWLLRTDMPDKEDKAREVYNRACTHHLPDKVEVHLAWAAFEEQRGRQHQEKAIEILQNLEKRHPNLMSVILRRINLERRSGNTEAVHTLYKSCIDKAKTPQAKSELAIKYSRFLRLSLNDSQAARIVLEGVLDGGDAKNAKIYLQLLDIELHAQPLEAGKVAELLDRAIKVKDMPGRPKMLFSQRKIEFLEDFGQNVAELLKAKEDHDKLTEEVKKEVKTAEASNEKSIETIEGRSGGSKSKKNGAASASEAASTTYAATNSASYNAAHASNYDQYGSRYNYGGQYGQYYQGYYNQQQGY
jgi:pre-mRNA-processing factor 39